MSRAAWTSWIEHGPATTSRNIRQHAHHATARPILPPAAALRGAPRRLGLGAPVLGRPRAARFPHIAGGGGGSDARQHMAERAFQRLEQQLLRRAAEP